MDTSNCKNLRFLGIHLNSLTCKCLALFVLILVIRTALFSSFNGFDNITNVTSTLTNHSMPLLPRFGHKKPRFLEVPQIVWGLNNQKIAFARSCLTARMMNRTLLMPSLSASLFYKEIDLLQPIPFEKVFQFDRFNSLCKGFIQLGRYSSVSNASDVLELQKGSGRKWTKERDLDQLREFSNDPYDEFETIRVVGKNPFLWHDHWPVKDYAKVFQCLVLVEEISKEADKVVSKISEIGNNLRTKSSANWSSTSYVAVHMRIEKDWMIHCKKLEHKSNTTEICSSKEEIMNRVGHILGLKTPIVVYLAVADSLLEDNSILNGWKDGLIPFEKKKLGVVNIYKRHPYLIQSAIDYEVCLRANVFVGNSFSTFSSLIVLERTQRMIEMGIERPCGVDVKWPSYAYNILGQDSKGPRRWITNLSDLSLQAISYGSHDVSC